MDAPVSRALLSAARPDLELPRHGVSLLTRSLPVDRATAGGLELLLGYRLYAPRAELLFRVGYRYGLPLVETPFYEDTPVRLTSSGPVTVSAGTVARMQLEQDGFRDIAGSRIMRLAAVPGLRFRFGMRSPIEAGMGMLAGVRPPWARGGFLVDRVTGVVQMSGRF